MLLYEVGYVCDLHVGDPRSLCAYEAGVLALEQHVSLADEVFRARVVKDRARVYGRRCLERDSSRDVRLYGAGYDLRVRTLRCED